MDLQNDNRTPRDRVDDDFRRFLTESGDGSFEDKYERAEDAIPAFAPFAASTEEKRVGGCAEHRGQMTAANCAPARTSPVTVRRMERDVSCGCGNVTREASSCGCGNVAREASPSCECGNVAREASLCGCGRSGGSAAPAESVPLPERLGCTGLSPERMQMMNAQGCPMPNCGVDPVGELDGSFFPVGMVYSPVQTFVGIKDTCCALEAGTVFAALDLPFERGRIRKGAVR